MCTCYVAEFYLRLKMYIVLKQQMCMERAEVLKNGLKYQITAERICELCIVGMVGFWRLGLMRSYCENWTC